MKIGLKRHDKITIKGFVSNPEKGEVCLEFPSWVRTVEAVQNTIPDHVRRGQIWLNSKGNECVILDVSKHEGKFLHVLSGNIWTVEPYKFHDGYWTLYRDSKDARQYD